MKISIKFTALILITTICGCATMSDSQRETAQGAAIGAGAGAALGAIFGKGKGAAIGASSGAILGAGAGYLWSKRMEEQKKQMESATNGTGVQVSQTEDNRLKLSIPSDISFNSGSDDIKPSLKPILDSFATSLIDNPTSSVMILGHTDSTGSDEINNPLSVNRAASTRDYLVGRGVPINRIQIDGRGSREPVAANDTPTHRAENRRVEIFVSEAQAIAPAEPQQK